MNVPAKLAVFAATAAVAFAGAFAVGAVTDPIAPVDDTIDLATSDGSSEDGGHSGMAGMTADPASPEAPGPVQPGVVSPAIGPVALGLPGLGVSDRGYTLRVADTTPGQGSAVAVAFTVASPDGGPVLNYRLTHEKEMHLIVVRRDMSGFQHLHPEQDADGTWTVPVNLEQAGTYRVFADFAPAALTETLTLGSDLFVPGDFAPIEIPAPSTTWSGDDYEVALTGTPVPGAESELGFAVSRSGTELSDLEPYLGAFGHLVSLRSGDLAYLHTHPAEEATGDQRGGPEIRFGTTFPTAGKYRLYLNFAHGGTVRTAEFTVDVPEGAPGASTPAASAPPAPSTSTEPASGGHSGH